MTSARNHHSAFRPPTVSRSQSTRGRTPQLSRFHIPRIPRMPETSYLNSPPSDEPQVLFYRLAEQSPVAPVPPSTCTSAERDSLEFELYKKKIEEELDRVAAEKLQLSPKRQRSYAELETTVPFSIKNQVTQLDPKAVHIMARPRSPHRKSEQESEQLQHLLDQQLLSVRQQLNSLSSERAKMEQQMEELMNGVKDARQLCARMPAPLSRPGVIRRARSVESQRQNLLRTHSQQPMMRKQFSDTTTCASPPLEEVDGEELEGEQHASASSLSSQEAEHKDNHVRSLSDSAGSPLFSSVSSLPVSGATYRLISHPGPFRRPASVSDFLDRHDSPTPIPELPEPPAHHRASTPHVCATYSPIKVHHRYSFRTRSSYVGPSPALSPLRGSPSKQSSSPGFFSLSDSNGHSWSSSSPQFTTTRVSKFNLNPRNHSQSSPPPSSANKNKKKGSPVLSQSDKDQELSYFRKNSLIHDNSFREGLVSFADDECELKGSGDNLSQVGSGSGSEYLTPTKTSSSSVILRRSSLTGQIEHVSHQKTQARRNSSYNTYLHSTDVGRLKETRMLSSSQGNLKNMAVAQVSNKAKNSKRKSKIIILNSKETTV